MTLFKQALLIITGLSVSFAVHTANYHFYENKPVEKTGKFVSDVTKSGDVIYDGLFEIKKKTPVPEPKPTTPDAPSPTTAQTTEASVTSTAPDNGSTKTDDGKKLVPPPNMSYTTEEFQRFKGTYLAKSDSEISDQYYNGVVFAGDSLTYGLGLTLFKDKDVVAYGGLSVYDYADYKDEPSYNQSEQKYTPLQWLSRLQPEVLYLQLGTNGIYSFSNQYHINLYNKLLDRIIKACPKTKIVIVSIPPWGKWREKDDFNSKKVDHFNMYLLELAYNRGMYFLNTAEVFRDSDGSMPRSLVGDDGIHWNREGRNVYLDYFKTHPIPGRAGS